MELIEYDDLHYHNHDPDDDVDDHYSSIFVCMSSISLMQRKSGIFHPTEMYWVINSDGTLHIRPNLTSSPKT